MTERNCERQERQHELPHRVAQGKNKGTAAAGQQCGPSERLTLDPRGPWFGEHRSRYRFALKYAGGASVLDVACGAGFGVEMLWQAGARTVIGIDLERAVLAQARTAYSGEGRCFIAADGTNLPLGTGRFDLVTSFETLEHIGRDDSFVSELARVVKPSGVVVLSTPNREYTESNGQRCVNPYHIREYTHLELAKLLSQYFSSLQLFGQRLSKEYALSPFHSDHLRMPADPLLHARLLIWRAQNKLPYVVKDSLSRLVSRHPFYPREDHYKFEAAQIGGAPVLVAVCYP